MYRAQVGCRGILLLFGRGILKIFISPEASNASEVLTIAYNYLAVMGATLIILYLLHIYRSALPGNWLFTTLFFYNKIKNSCYLPKTDRCFRKKSAGNKTFHRT